MESAKKKIPEKWVSRFYRSGSLLPDDEILTYVRRGIGDEARKKNVDLVLCFVSSIDKPRPLTRIPFPMRDDLPRLFDTLRRG
jgi:hypothetical protein